MKNLAGLMKQAQQMQSKMEEMQAKLERLEMTGEAGAGLVRVTLNGKGDLRGVTIDPKVVDPADIEMLQDLIVAAHRDAKSKIEACRRRKCRKSPAACNCRRHETAVLSVCQISSPSCPGRHDGLPGDLRRPGCA